MLRGFLVALFFIALTIAFMRPVSLHPASMVFTDDRYDPLLNTWILAWASRSVVTDPTNLFHGNTFFPFRYILAYSENLLGLAPVTMPVNWLSGNALLAYNLALLTSFVLSGVGAYLLVRRLTGSTAGGLLAGVVYAFAPYKIAQLIHIQELSAQWMPLAMFFLHRALATRRWRDFIGFGVCFTMQALSCLYYASLFGMTIVLFGAFVLAFRRQLVTWGVVAKSAVVGLISAAVLFPLSLPYRHVQREYGFTRPAQEVTKLSAGVQDYVTAPPGNKLYGAVTASFRPKQFAEHCLFPGLIAIVCAGIGFIGFRKLRSRHEGDAGEDESSANHSWFEPTFYAALMLIAFVLTLGPDLQFFGRQYNVPMPYRLFAAIAPGSQGMRVPARFAILVLLGLSVLAGYGMAVLTQSNGRRPARLVLAAVLVGVACAEYYSTPEAFAIPSGQDQIPAVYRWLATLPREETIVAEIPATPLERNAWYEYYSTYHWQTILNGHSSLLAPLDTLPDAAAVDILRMSQAGLVIFHPSYIPDEPNRAEMIQLLDASNELILTQVFDDNGDRVYRVRGIDSKKLPSEPLRLEPVVPRVVRAESTFSIPLRAMFRTDVGTYQLADRQFNGVAKWDGQNSQSIDGLVRTRWLPNQSDVCAVNVSAPAAPGRHRLELQLSGPAMTVTGAWDVDVVPTLRDTSQREGHQAEISILNTTGAPIQVKPTTRVRIDFTVNNTGETIWLAPPQPEQRGVVAVRVRKWIDSKGVEFQEKGKIIPEGRVTLFRPLWPGQSLKSRMYASVPSVPGRYKAVIDICGEWVVWFGSANQLVPPEIDVVVE